MPTFDRSPARAAARRSHPAKRPELLADDVHFIGATVAGFAGRVVGEEAELRRLRSRHWLDALDHEPTSVPDHEELTDNGRALVRSAWVALSNIGMALLGLHAGHTRRGRARRLASAISWRRPILLICVVPILALCLMAGTAHAGSVDSLIERLDRLEEENRQLWRELDELEAEQHGREETEPRIATPAFGDAAEDSGANLIDVDPEHGYEILDPTTNINRKQLLILERKMDGTLAPDRVHVQGAVTAIANYQSSNRANKFGYLMRHPTAANQVGNTVSEATIHSAQLGFTGTLGDWITGHAVMLFDPEQSFGEGTNTALERNQLQMRHAYVLFGNLDRSPFYASLGKMAIPFGLTDTVNPFTASTVWHAFGGLANGVTVGYANDGLNVSVMGIQGGAQFRAANAPVDGTDVPSKLNNFAVDASYGLDLGLAGTILLGGSFQHGTAYCQDFPVVHFEPCQDNNPAFDFYGQLVLGELTLKGEFARTTDEWPGTFNPAIAQHAASKVTSFDIGAKYRYVTGGGPLDFSIEFSRFVAGPDGAPWENQDQLVLGTAWFVRPNAKLFAEYIRVDGYAPLNFISGGNIRDESGAVIPDQTHSDSTARSDVFMVGVNVAF